MIRTFKEFISEDIVMKNSDNDEYQLMINHEGFKKIADICRKYGYKLEYAMSTEYSEGKLRVKGIEITHPNNNYYPDIIYNVRNEFVIIMKLDGEYQYDTLEIIWKNANIGQKLVDELNKIKDLAETLPYKPLLRRATRFTFRK